MLLEILILATGGLLLLLLVVLVTQACKSQLVWWRFQRDTKGLPLSDGRNIFCNHTIRWGLHRNNLNELKRFNESQGKPKTVGWLLGNQYAACTMDLDLMKRIVLDEPNKNINRADLNVPLAEYMEDNIMLAHDNQWRRLRRAIAPALRATKFKAPNVLQEIDQSIGKLINGIEMRLDEAAKSKSNFKSKPPKIQLELDDMVHRYSLNLVFSCFYKQYNQIDFNAKHSDWTRRVDEGLEGVIKNPLVKLGIMIDPLKRLIDWAIWNFHPQGEWRREILHFIRLQLNQSIRAREELRELKKQKAQVNEDDFVLKDGTRFRRNMADYITDHLIEGRISEREFFNSSSFLVAAADKTAADGLVHTIYQLAINPKIQAKTRQAVLSDGSEAEYLNWVVSESLRIMPPAPIACSRAVAEDMVIDGGYVLPAKTLVVFPNYLIHRLKEYWGEDAEEFKPERWADTSHHHPLQYVPFGAGVRKCPGREFALFEMKKLLTELLLRYKFECQPKEDAFTFDSPFLIYLVFNSPTYISIERLNPDDKQTMSNGSNNDVRKHSQTG